MSISRDGGNMDRGPEDPYLNSKHLFYTTTWGDLDGGNHDFDELNVTGTGRTALKTVEFEVDKYELIEIHGFAVDTGDPVQGTGKFDVWMWNGEPNGDFWRDVYEDQYDADDVLHHYTAQVDGDNNNSAQTDDVIFFPKPVLNSGRIGVTFREGPNDVGESAGRVFYTVREFDESTVLNEKFDSMV